MTNLAEDVQFWMILAGGGSLTALAVSRVKYGKDWYDPWITVTKASMLLGLLAVAINEWRAIGAWWSADPVFVSLLLLSLVGCGLTVFLRWTGTQASHVDLDLAKSDVPRKIFVWPLAAWGVLNLCALLYLLAR